MATYTATFDFYENFFEVIAETINLSTDTFKIGLTTSSYTPNLATNTVVGDVTNEVSGNGYAQQTLASVTYSQTGGVATFDFANPVFTASGGSIVARRFFIYDDTTASKWLIGTGLLDSTNADVTTTAGNTLTMVVNASGLFTVQEAP